MQRIIAVTGGVNAYLLDRASCVDAAGRSCPFCPDGHRLRRHGSYQRFAILPETAGTVLVVIMRFLCSRERRTLSLLPDFCLPGRQHGPGILGEFLDRYAVRGMSLRSSMVGARPDAPMGHSLAQELLAGFHRRLPQLSVWLASRTVALARPPDSVPKIRAHLAIFVLKLRSFGSDTVSAFTHASRLFHEATTFGLA